MKTAEQWVSEWRSDSNLDTWRYAELDLEERFKQIQLDAWKQGMTDAAKQVADSTPEAPTTAEDDWIDHAVDSILSARDNKTTI